MIEVELKRKKRIAHIVISGIANPTDTVMFFGNSKVPKELEQISKNTDFVRVGVKKDLMTNIGLLGVGNESISIYSEVNYISDCITIIDLFNEIKHTIDKANKYFI